MINLKKLRNASVVAEEGSLIAAANRLNISHSALSRSIQSLEAYHSIQLFERDQKGAKLTPEGASFIKIADDLLRTASYAEDQMRLLLPARQPPVRFGMGPITAATFLPDLIPLMTEDGLQLQIKVGSNSELQLLLRHGEIDFFVGYVPRGGSARPVANDLAFEKISDPYWSLLVRNDHPLLAQDLSPSNLIQYPVVAGSFVRDTLRPDAFESIGLQHPSIEYDDYALLANIVKNGDYILLATNVLAVARAELELVCLPIPFGIEYQADWSWSLIYSSQRELSEAAQRAASLAVDRMKQMVAAANSLGL